ncbi:deoxyribose-phosphate aldolase [Metallumcola ferriviriculae]|uniref:Deoxyribose-phosphate aldolase n=1 Tax=Metallumcola ferriviriculae TaxID=3039180 RepID=A0AAU0UQZ9_9FIRM|nr:deoxyribose-phosphate aldolase [Desulfitibacteraceae bacterium MK1]
MTKNEMAKMIDHTLLKAEAAADAVKKLCQEAAGNNFASVCINPSYVKLASLELAESDVDVCTVIGFPLGATTWQAKAFEAKQAVTDGAAEVDMVINVGALKSGMVELVEQEIKAVVKAAGADVLVKVIIETCYLTDEEKVAACKAAKQAGADFVKTSTGFGTGGATEADIKLMRDTVGPEMGVKASGGVRTYQDATTMINAGATRIGASAGIKIISEME